MFGCDLVVRPESISKYLNLCLLIKSCVFYVYSNYGYWNHTLKYCGGSDDMSVPEPHMDYDALKRVWVLLRRECGGGCYYDKILSLVLYEAMSMPTSLWS